MFFQVMLPVVSGLLLVIAVGSVVVKKPVARTNLPDGLVERFKIHCDLILANLNVTTKDADLSRFRLLEQVPFGEGDFEFYRFDYRIQTNIAVADTNGMVLTTDQLFEKAGAAGDPILLFYREKDDIYEISFVSDRELGQKGYKGYIQFRYGNPKKHVILDEYSLRVDSQEIKLWQNLAGEVPFEGAKRIRERTHDLLKYVAQFTDTWEGKEVKLNTLVQFEKKREYVYSMRTTNPGVETKRGIHVGSTVRELKAAYPEDLGYMKDFKASGPAFGYIPKDKSSRYIAFRAQGGQVIEIWVVEGFDERPFSLPKGYVDDDIEWIDYDNSDKLTERYAREIYVGQHKSDFDVDKVFQSFIAKELIGTHIQKTGVIKGAMGTAKAYYVICEKRGETGRLYLEVKMEKIKLKNSVTGDEIWVVDQYRSQIKTDCKTPEGLED